MDTDRRESLLYSAAFGPDPAAASAECGGVLPTARTPYQCWLRGVAHGGFGHYARAAADVRGMRGGGDRGGRGDAADAAWSSLAGSTWASLLRQMGGHAAAAVRDGRALAVLAGAPAGSADVGPWLRVARADALTGLAADRLGRGDWRGARRLLERCAAYAGLPGGPGGSEVPGLGARGPDAGILGGTRLLLRWQWVSAETAMTAGYPDAALAAARCARDTAGAFDSERHRIKTVLVHAAAEAVAGREREAQRLGELARRGAGASGLAPLQWASCMLLAGVAFGTDAGRRAERERDRVARRIRTRGGDAGLMARYV